MSNKKQVSQQEALNAVRTLLLWAGDDPNRDGLRDTPKRVCKAYKEWFKGYDTEFNPDNYKFFDDLNSYQELIIQKNIVFYSTCEHHMSPIIGKAHIGYFPNKKIIGLSKFARIIEIFAKRLQMQERLTEEIAIALNDLLQPKGVIIVLEAEHLCMSSRGVNKQEIETITQSTKGCFCDNSDLVNEFYLHLKK